jgi:UDP-N-acetyl-D-galactosamine dehydrogenase
MVPFQELKPASAVVLAVAHRQFREMALEAYKGLMNGNVLIDVKGIFTESEAQQQGLRFWRL